MAEYNSSELSISFGGVPLTGFGEDTMVSISWDTDITTDKIGVDGVVTASKTRDYRATVEITLMETSPSNAVLNGFFQARRLGGSSIGAAPLFIENTLTGESVTDPSAWVLKAPDVEYGREASERTWMVRCQNLQYTHTGLQPA